MNNFEYIMSQFGSRENKRLSDSLAIDVHELPGTGWKLVAKRQWRTGARSRPQNEVTQRASEIGTFSTWKSFELTVNQRWVWIEVIPVCSSLDAITLIPDLRSILVTNSKSRATLVEENQNQRTGLIFDSETWTYEQLTEGPEGTGSMRLIGSHVENVVYIVACSAFEPSWTWSEVAQIAALEASKIRGILKSK